MEESTTVVSAKPEHEFQPWSKRNHHLLSYIVIIALVVLSWSGILDKLSYKSLDDSFISAVQGYATARVINAGISVAQTSTLSVGFASITPGEWLDPFNDMIERFADLITLAVGSIVAQKILLNIVSSIFFKAMLTLSAVALISSSLMKGAPYFKLFSRAFIFIVFLRLSISVMALLNYTVDQFFIKDMQQSNQQQIDTLSVELSELTSLKGKSESNEETETDGFFAELRDSISSSVPSIDVDKIKATTESMVINYLNLMIIWLLKTVGFPLLFLYFWLKVFKQIWAVDFRDFVLSRYKR
ncbi:MAG: hypothetical protein COA74_07825 [Gammaproteobacteria bacterium]|nr:MAG: hypothetical protein COA74_07825 [Gammaproteobacteria bacterium]